MDNSKKSDGPTIEDLPVEIYPHITKYLSLKAYIKFFSLSRKLRDKSASRQNFAKYLADRLEQSSFPLTVLSRINRYLSPVIRREESESNAVARQIFQTLPDSINRLTFMQSLDGKHRIFEESKDNRPHLLNSGRNVDQQDLKNEIDSRKRSPNLEKKREIIRSALMQFQTSASKKTPMDVGKIFEKIADTRLLSTMLESHIARSKAQNEWLSGPAIAGIANNGNLELPMRLRAYHFLDEATKKTPTLDGINGLSYLAMRTELPKSALHIATSMKNIAEQKNLEADAIHRIASTFEHFIQGKTNAQLNNTQRLYMLDSIMNLRERKNIDASGLAVVADGISSAITCSPPIRGLDYHKISEELVKIAEHPNAAPQGHTAVMRACGDLYGAIPINNHNPTNAVTNDHLRGNVLKQLQVLAMKSDASSSPKNSPQHGSAIEACSKIIQSASNQEHVNQEHVHDALNLLMYIGKNGDIDQQKLDRFLHAFNSAISPPEAPLMLPLPPPLPSSNKADINQCISTLIMKCQDASAESLLRASKILRTLSSGTSINQDIAQEDAGSVAGHAAIAQHPAFISLSVARKHIIQESLCNVKASELDRDTRCQRAEGLEALVQKTQAQDGFGNHWLREIAEALADNANPQHLTPERGLAAGVRALCAIAKNIQPRTLDHVIAGLAATADNDNASMSILQQVTSGFATVTKRQMKSKVTSSQLEATFTGLMAVVRNTRADAEDRRIASNLRSTISRHKELNTQQQAYFTSQLSTLPQAKETSSGDPRSAESAKRRAYSPDPRSDQSTLVKRAKNQRTERTR